jgi:uncharacterized protein YkwD
MTMHPHPRHAALLVLILTALFGGCPVADNPGADPADGNDPNGTSNVSPNDQSSDPDCGVSPNENDWKAEILRLVNVERERESLNPVVWNQTLANQAEEYACEMIVYDFFAHENPETGSHLADRADEFGYDYQMIGENLAAGQATPAQAMWDWMNSEGHRANILNANFTELGVGVRVGGDYDIYWVQEFGLPAGD